MGKNLSKSARPPAMILGLTCANLNGYSFCSICQFVDTLPLSREIFVEDDDCIWSEYYIPDVLDSHPPPRDPAQRIGGVSSSISG